MRFVKGLVLFTPFFLFLSFLDLLFALPPNYEIALELFDKKEYDKSLEKIREVFDNYRNSVEFRLLAASDYLEMNKFDNSRQHLNYALISSPQELAIYILYADLLSHEKNPNEAFAKLQKALQIPNKNSEIKNLILYTMAKIHYENKNLSEARKIVEQIISASPLYIPAVYLDGIMHLNQGNYEFAEIRFKSLIVLANLNNEIAKKIYNNLGFIYEMKANHSGKNARDYKKNLEIAKNYYQISLLYDPNYTIAKENLSRL